MRRTGSLSATLAALRLRQARALVSTALNGCHDSSPGALQPVRQVLMAYLALCHVSSLPRPGLSALVSMVHCPESLAALLGALPELQVARCEAVMALLQCEREACDQQVEAWTSRCLRIRALERCLQRLGGQGELQSLSPVHARLEELRDCLFASLMDWLVSRDSAQEGSTREPSCLSGDMAFCCDGLLRLEKLLWLSGWPTLAQQLRAMHASLLLSSLRQQSTALPSLLSALLSLSLQVQGRLAVQEEPRVLSTEPLSQPPKTWSLQAQHDLAEAISLCCAWLQRGGKLGEEVILASYRVQRLWRTLAGGEAGVLAEAWHALLLWHWQEGALVPDALWRPLTECVSALSEGGDPERVKGLQLQLLLWRHRLQWRQSAHRPFARRAGQLPESALPMLLATGLDAVMQPLSSLQTLVARPMADPVLMQALCVLARGAAALRLVVIGQLAEQLVESWQWWQHTASESQHRSDTAALLLKAHQALQEQINQAAAWHAAPPCEDVLQALCQWNAQQRERMSGLGRHESFSARELTGVCREFVLKLRSLLQLDLHVFCTLNPGNDEQRYPEAVGSALQQLLSFLLVERLESPEQRQRRSRTASNWLWLTLGSENGVLCVEVRCDALPGPLSSRRLARLGRRLSGQLQAHRGEMPNGARGWVYRWCWQQVMAL